MLYRTVLGTLVVLMVTVTSGSAQDGDLLSQWYGSGVHAYFSGDTTRALEDLTQAAEGGSADPRVYYFRALTYLRMGQSDAAAVEMATGAALEVKDREGRYPVSRSLERIQGRQRLLLERYRRKSRVATYRRQQVRRRQRYEVLRRQEQQVLRRQIAVPLDQLAVPVSGTSPIERQAPTASANGIRSLPPLPKDHPAGGHAMPHAGQGVTAEAQPAVGVEQPVAAGGLAEAPGQLTPSAQPPVSVPEREKVDAGKLGKILSRVLGKSLPDGEQPAAGTRDPFSGATPTPEAPAPASKAPAPAPADSDPFGDAPVPDAAPAKPAPPAAASEDLFGGDTIEPTPQSGPADVAQPVDTPPAAKSADPDPFGEEADPFGDADPAPAVDAGAADPGPPASARPENPESDPASDPGEADQGEADQGDPFADG